MGRNFITHEISKNNSCIDILVGSAGFYIRKLNRLVTGLEDGEIRLHPSRSFELNLLQNQKDQASRITSSIFSCGFLISGVILLEGPYSRVGLLLIFLSALTFTTF